MEEDKPTQVYAKVEIVKKPIYKRWWMIMLYIVVGLSILGSVLSSPQETGQVVTPSDTAPATPVKTKEPIVEDFLKIGSTFEGSVWAYTVHGVREADRINEQGNEFMVAEAGADEKFVIVDFEIKNVTKETQIFSSMVSGLKIRAAGGFTFDQDFEAEAALRQTLDENQIGPGLSNRGEIAFKVRKDATDLMFEVGEESGAIWKL